ncbi:DUF4185 domain-containing protein [Phytohabitans houttuyneae]|uniref:DUF4185 domain-containing protein n=1 Tax=Phytohabitans houttuyneae TaxID=1076126 RepID=A0A6V8KC40_9ACTN|nr:DUF4185 domain-containing protein [Phytohabitans houttuyneae]GFJ82802.1 hypothetical protein Phou_069820 [Phytohabitans houttuyneae]
MRRRTILGGAAGATALTVLSARPAAAAPRTPTGSPNAPLNTLFNTYGNTGAGWTGADSTYSTPLPDGRRLWMYSDTFLGPVNPDLSRPLDTPFLRNSMIVQDGQRLTTVHGGTAAEPTTLLAPASGDNWYWIGAGIAVGGVLNQTVVEFGRTGTGPWDFAWMGTHLARMSVGRLNRVIDIRPLPSGAEVTWAAWLQPVGRHVYVYGVEDRGVSKYLHVARVAGRDLRGRWEFWTGSGWSTVETDSARVMEGVSNEHSVTPWRGRWLLVTQDTTELFSAKIVAYVGDSPTGPFTGKTLLYTTPETGATGTYGNANVYTYNPHVHPELSTDRRLLVSYNVNSFDSDDLYEDVTIYRGRFVDVTLA